MKKVATKLLLELCTLLEAVIISLENNYYSLFRGGIFLIGISLAGLSQTMPILLDHDYAAMELKFEFEEKSNVKLSVAECSDFETLYKTCSLAKYKAHIVSSTVKLLKEERGQVYFKRKKGVRSIL